MTEDEKLVELKKMIKPDVVEEELLRSLLRRSKSIVLNKRYPFGPPANTEVPTRYEDVQLEIAVELYSKIGIEGQTSHSESGISRHYETGSVSSSLLSRIMPVVGSVVSKDA